MPCKPGVAGSIPGFYIKPLSVEPSGVPVILINTQIINPSGPVLVSTHGKATKSFFCHLNQVLQFSIKRCDSRFLLNPIPVLQKANKMRLPICQ